MNDSALMIGRLHPLIVHLPIGILLFAALLEAFALLKKQNYASASIIRLSILVGAGSAALAALFGYYLSFGGGYDEDTLFWHQWMGIGVAVLSSIIFLLKSFTTFDIQFGKLSLSQWVLTLTLALTFLVGHLGGNLTHGEGYLTEHLPPSIKSILTKEDTTLTTSAMPTNIDSVVVFKHVIQPILTEKCIRCHNPSKAQGGLDLTTEEGINKGGKSGHAIRMGDIEKSEIVKRVSLPRTSTRFMPTSGLPPLTPMEVKLLKWWIESGTEFSGKVATSSADEKIKYMLASYIGINTETETHEALPFAPALSSNKVKELRDLGLVVNILSAHTNLLDVSFVMQRKASAEEKKKLLAELLKIKDNIIWLDLSNCNLTDKDIASLGQLTNLHKLKLQNNSITSEGIKALQGLHHLEYINLHSNQLDDRGTELLSKISSLKKIDLWNNRLSPARITALSSQASPEWEVGK